MKLFVALDVPERISAALAEIELPRARGIRRVPQHQMHLTVCFIGDAALGDVRPALQSLECKPCPVSLRGLGTFRTGGGRAILWAGVSRSRELLALHAACVRALADVGVRLERRRFVPHVTLARLPPFADDDLVDDFVRAHEERDYGRFLAEHLVLYDSVTRDEGARYESLARYSMRSGARCE